METILYVCGCLALICLAALFFYLIRFFSSAKILVDKSANTMEQLVEEIKIVRVEAKETLDNLDVLMQNLIPTIENLNISMVKVNQQLDSVEVITQRAKNVSLNIERASEDVSYAVSKASNIATAVVGVQQYMSKKNKKNVTQTVGVIGAIAKAIDAFKERYVEVEMLQNGDITHLYQNEGYDDVYKQ